MAADVIDHWLRSSQQASIHQLPLRPLAHTALRDVALSVQRGQAEVFILSGPNWSRLILKKFHSKRGLDRAYLENVSHVLPLAEGFQTGKQRVVLEAASLARANGYYHTDALARWLDGTVLMPAAPGMDWASLADALRAGDMRLYRQQRITLCRNLNDLVMQLENHSCSHRDLSAGNVFIDPRTLAVYLIDFDSLYHPTLRMPNATTCGTEGYVPPFVYRLARPDAVATWCLHADRFALAILNVEFLILDTNAPITADGGLFDQNELRNRRGPGIQRILGKLRVQCPQAIPLYEQALHAAGCDGCPSPQDWNRMYATVFPPPPRLADIPAFN